MNPLGILLTLLFGGMVFAGSRRWAALGMVGATCYITQGQALDLIGFNFTAIRIVGLIGLFRAFSRGEISTVIWTPIDKGLFLYAISVSAIFPLSRGTFSAFTYQLGCTYNIIVPFLVFRSLLNDLSDVKRLLADSARLIVPFAFLMILESFSGRNMFAIMGGVLPFDELREGHYRCCGAFRSPITGGTFGATMSLFFAALFFGGGSYRKEAILGFITSTIITICSRSSGPLMSYILGLACYLFWRKRDKLFLVRRGMLVGLIVLHLIMKAPVWFLIARVSDLIGGGGWHRAQLIDVAVKHFSEWWLMGTSNTGGWMPTSLAIDGAADLTNQFVAAGVTAGLFAMILLIRVIVLCFRHLGFAMEREALEERFNFGLGASLVGTTVNFFSVSYFDQIDVIWYLQLALISAAAFTVTSRGAVPVDETAQPDFASLPRLA